MGDLLLLLLSILVNGDQEFDIRQQFWVELNATSTKNPPGLWGMAGGTDTAVSVRVPTPPNFLNTLFVLGGTSESSTEPLSSAWNLVIDGALSENTELGNQGGAVSVEWQQNTLNLQTALPQKVGESSVVLPGGTAIVVNGGCNSTGSNQVNVSCAGQDTYIINPSGQPVLDPSPAPCPAPRYYGSLVNNYNGFTNAFASQVFLLFGAFDHSMWDDGGGSLKGEVVSTLIYPRLMK